MADTELGVSKAMGSSVVEEVLDEYGSKLRISGASRILVSDPQIAAVIKERYPGEVGQWSPSIDFTYDISKPDGSGVLQGAARDESQLTQLKDEWYTHVIINVSTETDKESFRIFKWVHWCLQPKGVAIWVIPTKDGIVNAMADAKGTSVEEAMWWQRTPARLPIIEHVFVKSSFEIGKIRLSERDLVLKGKQAEAKIQRAKQGLAPELAEKFDAAVKKQTQESGGIVQQAYVVMAMKWDQLTG